MHDSGGTWDIEYSGWGAKGADRIVVTTPRGAGQGRLEVQSSDGAEERIWRCHEMVILLGGVQTVVLSTPVGATLSLVWHPGPFATKPPQIRLI